MLSPYVEGDDFSVDVLTGSGCAEGVSLAFFDAGEEEGVVAGVVAGVVVEVVVGVVGVVAGLSAFLVEVGSVLDVVIGSFLWTTSMFGEGIWVSFACASESLHASSLVVPSSSLKVPALRPAQTSFKGTV